MNTAILISIGNEILAGNTVDTNSNFIAGELQKIGISVIQIIAIPDEVSTIVSTLSFAFNNTDLVITTGGLGPTRDDKTKSAFCKYFQDNLVLDSATLDHLKQILLARKREYLLSINYSQAEIPSTAYVFQNDYGTAPAILMNKNGKIAICLPGVPYEVKPLIKDKIIPHLQKIFQKEVILNKIISVVGIPESLLSQRIENWEMQLPKNVTLAYLPIANRIQLKLTAFGYDEENLKQILEIEYQKLKPTISENIISENGDKIEEILKDIMIKKKLSICTAESCTGGELARLITSVSGSSAYFLGAVVAYDFQQKINVLGVSEQTITQHTTVSKEVAQEMSFGVQKLMKSEVSISTTGVAGPNADNYGNEIGKVYYSIRVRDYEKTFFLNLPHLERKDFMNFVAMKAIQDLVQMLISGQDSI